MQVVTVPKEVIWATRLLWLSLIIPFIALIIIGSMFGSEASLLSIFRALPKFFTWLIVILGVNHFILKRNKWVAWVTIVTIAIHTLMLLSTLTQDGFLMVEIIYLIRIVLGLSIIYLLIKRRDFFEFTK